jgi:rubrerythrin
MGTTYRLFDVAERIELVAEEIYDLLALRFDGVPSARDLFRRLAREESQHAARIRLLAARYRTDPRLFDGAHALRPGALDAEALLRDAAETRRQIAAGAWDGSLDAVREQLAAFEASSAALHAELLAAGAHPDVRGFFEQLALQDREHERLLAALPRRAVA